MDIISINFENAKRQADRLCEQANVIRRNVNKEYRNSIQKLSGDWKSDSASEYLMKAEKLSASMMSLASDLDRIAANIRRTAQRIYDAEREAERIARERL